MDDPELLRAYAESRSEIAFTELVRRHIDFVFATAQRMLGGDAHRANDVAQQVFNELARKSASLTNRRALEGWLYLTTRNTASFIVRGERRRIKREQEAQAMQALMPSSLTNSEWDQMRPMIDQVLSALANRDREAVLLRFFQQRTFSQIGERFSISDDAARLRVERALEKMRRDFSRLGVTSTTSIVAAMLTGQAAVGAPPGLAASVAGVAIATAGGPVLGGSAIGGLIYLMGIDKIAVATIGAVLAVGTATVTLQYRTNAKLAAQTAALESQTADFPAIRKENQSLVRLLAEKRSLEQENREAAALSTGARSLRNEIADLRTESAVQVARASARDPKEARSFSEAGTKAFAKISPLVAAKDYDGAIEVIDTLIAAVPADSHDRLAAEDMLGRLDWQGKNSVFDALAHFETAEEMLQQHPGDFSSEQKVYDQQSVADLNLIVGLTVNGAMPAGRGSVAIVNGPPALGSPNQWFPAAKE